MKRFIVLSSLALLGLVSEFSFAIESNLQLFTPASVSVDFDPFAGLPGLQSVDFEFSLTQDKPRTVKLIITSETGIDFEFDTQDVPVELKVETNSDTHTAGRFETLVNLEPNQANLLDVNFKVLTGQYANAGTHELNLLINVEDVVTGEKLVTDRPLRIDCVVPSRAQTNFAGMSPGFDNGIGIATLDFGKIVFGDSRQVQFQIRGNSDVTVEISSENNGYMVNEDNAGISPIPYMVDADGMMSDMSVPLSFSRRPEKSLSGSRYPLKVTIEEPEGGAYSGNYHDILSIDVTPN